MAVFPSKENIPDESTFPGIAIAYLNISIPMNRGGSSPSLVTHQESTEMPFSPEPKGAEIKLTSRVKPPLLELSPILGLHRFFTADDVAGLDAAADLIHGDH